MLHYIILYYVNTVLTMHIPIRHILQALVALERGLPALSMLHKALALADSHANRPLLQVYFYTSTLQPLLPPLMLLYYF
jgi:hypothetical protein